MSKMKERLTWEEQWNVKSRVSVLFSVAIYHQPRSQALSPLTSLFLEPGNEVRLWFVHTSSSLWHQLVPRVFVVLLGKMPQTYPLKVMFFIPAGNSFDKWHIDDICFCLKWSAMEDYCDAFRINKAREITLLSSLKDGTLKSDLKDIGVKALGMSLLFFLF